MRDHRTAFSLIELLVAIAVVALLLGLVLLALRESRAAGQSTVSLSNLRQQGQAFVAYAADYDDQWPCFTSPGFFNNVIESPWAVLRGQRYFDAHRTWHIALGGEYFDAPHNADVFIPPGVDRDEAQIPSMYTPYLYSCAFIADPRFWSATSRQGPDQWRATRASEVLYPADKGLIFASWPYEGLLAQGNAGSIHFEAAFVDVSARRVRRNQILPGYRGGEGYRWRHSGAVHTSAYPHLMHTVDGARGRDMIDDVR